MKNYTFSPSLFAVLFLALCSLSSLAFRPTSIMTKPVPTSCKSLRVLQAAGSEDFAASRVARRLEAEAKRKAEQGRKAGEQAKMLADEAKRAEAALKRAVREAAAKDEKMASLDALVDTAKEASQWAAERVEFRMWRESLRRAAVARRVQMEEARNHAERSLAEKVAAQERGKWALEMVETRKRTHAYKERQALEQIMKLSKRMFMGNQARLLANEQRRIKQIQLEHAQWAMERVVERVQRQAQINAYLEQAAFERGLRLAMRSRDNETTRRMASREQRRRMAAAESAEWAASRVAVRIRKNNNLTAPASPSVPMN